MSRYLIGLAARWSLAVISLAILAAWSAPVWDRPDVAGLGVLGVKTLLLTAVVCGCALMVGLVVDRMEMLALRRPPTAAQLAAGLPVQFSTSVDAVRIAHDEALAPPAADEGWISAVSKFSFIGNSRGFGWRSMCPYVGRESWRTVLDLLIAAEVLSPARGNQDAEWINGWSYCKLRPALKYGGLPLPYPAGPAPIISWGRPSRNSMHAAHASAQEAHRV